jgi:predicted RNA-binding Zn ribbon-like protein
VGDVARFLHVGGHLGLDFVNTLGGRPDNPDDEYLHRYTDLLTWSTGSGTLPAATAAQLADVGAQHPERAGTALTRALEVRAALDHVLRARLDSQPADAAAIDRIRRSYADAVVHGRLDLAESGLTWSWPLSNSVDLDAPAWPVAAAAVDLLTAGSLNQLRRCAHCRWLFLDTSRNHSRRWCSMNACGALIKMRRHRARQREA